MRRITSLAVTIALVSSASVARGDEPADKRRCLAAYVAGQEAREHGKLRDARTEFETCGQESCPAAARKDCLEWMSQVDASIPSIVLGASDDTGRDLRDVLVAIDGKPLASAIDGRALSIDPGPHALRFEATGLEPATIELVVLEGQKNRLVQAQLTRRGVAPPPIATGPPAADRPRSLAAPMVVGGTAVVALGFFIGFAVTGAKQMRDLENGCGRTVSCRQDDVDSARTKLVVGDVALAIALVTGGVAAYLLLTR